VNRRPLLTALLSLTAALVVGELVSAVIIWKEAYAGGQPLFAVAFAALFAVAFWLQRSDRVMAGAVFAGALFLFEVVTFPTWQRYNALDWTVQILFGALSLVGFVVAVVVVGARLAAGRRTADHVSSTR
jgi:FtsH-binding integral membrane protein